ncbi:acyltransferase family protein [Shimia sp.]|uniref:acyltransferase family protein n=1 Tax=Shimia sp. TaxID=1954381 RepID=UPI003BAA496D
MQYRREIDGLRAVAVLPVILFHAGFSLFGGGYVGVDIFFVISGYLITSILIGELEQGAFSILRFYERRARRILPALFFVMLACLPFAYMWMLPSQLEDFANSVIAVVFFVSNVMFWQESGYFDAAAELKPLLHTWSLAVEEQYYLIFPVFLLLAWRIGRTKVFWLIVAIAVVSLLLSEWGWRSFASANFYLAPTRAWELLAGSICAFLTVGHTQRSNNFLSALGLALIMFAIFGYDKNTPFPSVYALLPVLGTALIILYADKDTWAARVLSTRGFVGVGLISYSAYLWHQPLFAFARLRTLTEPSHSFMALLGLASLLLAWGTWRWVEQPFRSQTNPIFSNRRHVFLASGAVGVAFVAVGVVTILGKGFDWRFGEDVQRFAVAYEDRADLTCRFDENRPARPHPQEACVSTLSRAVDVLAIGDSHMWALSDGLTQQLSQADIEYYSLSHVSCLPFLGFQTYEHGRITNCQDFLAGAYDWASDNDVSTIVLAARFPIYLHGSRYNNGEGGIEAGRPGWADFVERSSSEWNDDDRRARVLDGFETSIRMLAKRFNVVLVYPIPEAGWDVPSYGMRNVLFNDGNTTITTSYAVYMARTAQVNALFDRLVTDVPSIFGARVQNVLCSADTMRCLNADEQGIYYFDDDHLSNAGARLVAPMIVEEVQRALRAERAQ